VSVQAVRIARRPRDFVRVSGPDAEDYLQRMLSQDVAMDLDEAREALLLTAKARVIAPLVVLRRGHEDFLLSTEAGLGERVAAELRRFRFAAKAEIEPEPHEALVLFGAERPDGATAYPVADYGEPAWEVLDGDAPAGAAELGADELELLRIRAGSPRVGAEIDDRVLPAEAGLVERAVDFEKGCYPGQEPIARLHYRGHANRGLRVLRLEGEALPTPDAELTLDGKAVGRVTSAVHDPDGGVLALAYVRREVAPDADLDLPDGGVARSM
jgi:folate-binding protein YgfZ